MKTTRAPVARCWDSDWCSISPPRLWCWCVRSGGWLSVALLVMTLLLGSHAAYSRCDHARAIRFHEGQAPAGGIQGRQRERAPGSCQAAADCQWLAGTRPPLDAIGTMADHFPMRLCTLQCCAWLLLPLEAAGSSCSRPGKAAASHTRDLCDLGSARGAHEPQGSVGAHESRRGQ